LKLSNFSKTQVLVIGDVMIDSYLFGEINRISPEAPVPVVEIDSKEMRAGGAANVAINIKSLGGKPVLLSATGNDLYSRELVRLLKEKGVKTNHIIQSSERTTTVKTRIFDEDKQVMRYDEEDAEDMSRELEEQLLLQLQDILKREKISMIILQDYNKGLLTKRIIKQVLLIATKNAIPVSVDPKEKNFFEYQNVTLFKPNLKELSVAIHQKINPKDITSLREAAEELKRKNRFRNLMLTLGPHGIFYYNEAGESDIVAAKPINAADVSGAGDTVISIAALTMAHQVPLASICRQANHLAGKVCRRVGVSPATKEDMKGYR
jgi:rfaE bifunctional protein kinase chain/domain